MWMHRAGRFASQGNMFSEAPLKRYMKKNCRLKFWRIKDLTKKERDFLLYHINSQLKDPWYKRMYDWVGVFGQAIGLKFINQPWQFYCSERMARDLKGIVSGLDPKSSPEDLNEAFKKSDRMEVYGRWYRD